MAAKLIILATALVACKAVPIWFTGGYVPGVVYREARAPAIAYGFGSGFSSDIAGIRQSNSIGASFNTGDGVAYGAGIAGSDGNVYANGIGYARAPAPATYQPIRYTGYDAYGRNYGNPVLPAQNYGNYGQALAQTHNGAYGSAAAAANNGRYQPFRGLGYGSAVSSATSNGYGTTSAATSGGGYGTAISSAQGRDAQGGYNTAVAASENSGAYKASTAQTVQQTQGGSIHTGATSIDGPGIQATHSHAVKTGYY